MDFSYQNFAYVSTIANGNVPGKYLITGPDWQGTVPEGIKEVIPSETQFLFSVFRTQLFNSDDLKNVKAIQEAYRLETLSAYLGTKPPVAAPALDFPQWKEGEQFTSAAFNYMNFMLTLVKTPDEEQTLMKKFAKIGLGTQDKFDINTFPPEIQKAIEEGFAEIEAFIAKNANDPLMSAKIFGTRAFLNKSAKENLKLDTLFVTTPKLVVK